MIEAVVMALMSPSLPHAFSHLHLLSCAPLASFEMDSVVGDADAAGLHSYHQHVELVLHIDSVD